MARRASVSDLAHALPLPALLKRGRGEGQVVHPLDLSLTWKIKADETGSRFSVFEMTIAPEAEIPIHVHPFPELFYVLDGQIDVMGLDGDGHLTWTPVCGGECANAPPGAPHGIKNRTNISAKFLSVSTPEHEKSFNDYQEFLLTSEGQAASNEQKAQKLMDIFAEQQITFLDVS